MSPAVILLTAIVALVASANVVAGGITTPPPAEPTKEAPLTPIPFHAEYDVSLNGSSQLKGSRALIQSGENEFTLEYKAKHILFKVKELSTFKWSNNQLIPLYYRSERSHLLGSSHKDVTFDWPNNQANFYYKEKDGQFALEPKAIDPLSTLFVISTKIQQGMKDITVRETEDNDIEPRNYKVDGPEILETPIGPLETIKATLHDKETASVWFAVDLNYLAVKLRQESKGGDIYEMNIKKYDGPRIERSLPTKDIKL